MICLLVCSCVFSSFCFDWDDLKKWGNVRESNGCDWSVKVQNLCLHSADNGEKSLPSQVSNKTICRFEVLGLEYKDDGT